MRTLILKVALAFAVLATPAAWAADAAGTVLYAAGKLTAEGADGKARDLQRRSEVFAGDVLKTDSGSQAQVRFSDGSIVALKPGSELRLDKYAYGGRETGGESLMSLLKGGFRTMTGAISKINKEAYKVNTPVATIGVRGTLYEASLGDDGLNLGVWDGGITACGEGGCIDLGMDSDFRFGLVPVGGGKPMGTQREPNGIGDAGDDGERDRGDWRRFLMRDRPIDIADINEPGATGDRPTRAAFPMVGYLLMDSGGMYESNYARATTELDIQGYPIVTGFTLFDTTNKRWSDAPPDSSCLPLCEVLPPSFSAGYQSIGSADGYWGQWTSVMVNGSLVPAGGQWVMGQALTPAQVAEFAAGTPSLTFNITNAAVNFSSGAQGSLSGSMDITFDGAVTGSLMTYDDSNNAWNINFGGTANNGTLKLAIDGTSNYTPFNESAVAIQGSISAQLVGYVSEVPFVEGLVGGVQASTTAPVPVTGQVESMSGIFAMAVPCQC